MANCNSHGRRGFVTVADAFPAECTHVLETMREVYKYDEQTRREAMSDQQRLLFHQQHSSPLMDALKLWMEEKIEGRHVEPNSALGEAITYMLKRWHRLTLFLRHPGAPLDNNICERLLKISIRHRNNSLFYKTHLCPVLCVTDMPPERDGRPVAGRRWSLERRVDCGRNV
jgi:hypothetical protein